MAEPIQVLYTCDACNAHDIPVTVPDRKDGEDLMTWMHATQHLVWQAHWRRNPGCKEKTLTYVKIPLPSEKGIGFTA